MRREKISPALRRKTVTEIETGRLSQREAAKRLNVGRVTIQGWLSKYRSEGSSGLERNSENRIYSVQAKQQAVKAYLREIQPAENLRNIQNSRQTAVAYAERSRYDAAYVSCSPLH